MKRIALFIVSVILFLPLSARNDYRYRNITMNDGLLANAVRNIVQDQYGFIWFGTDNGLCRYDGTQVQTYHIPECGSNQYISALLAHDGYVYVGTEKGVYRLSGETNMFEKLPLDIHSVVTWLTVDKDENLWASTMEDGVWQYALKSNTKKRYQLKGDFPSVAEVYADNTNQIWTVTNWGGPVVQKLNRLHDRFEPVDLSYSENYNALRMLQTRDGRMWLGTWGSGLLLMHGDGHLEQALNPLLTKVGIHIHALFERSDDCICIGCDEGVICFNPKTKDWRYLSEELQLPENVQNNRFVYSIISDTEGGLWTGSFYGGVGYASPVGKRFEAFTTESGLTGNVISRFCEDRQGRIWVASDDGGLMCYSPKEHRFITYPHQDYLTKRNIHGLCFDTGNDLWIGTYTDGVIVMNTMTGQLRQFLQTEDPNSLDNSNSYAIHHDTYGQIWVGTMGGLNLYDRERKNFVRIGKTNGNIIDIDEDRQGDIWLSTQGQGLFRYSRKTKKMRQYTASEKKEESLPDNQVNCVQVDERGILWIGTFGGLCTYDEKKDCFQRIPLEMTSQNVVGIVEDNGALWLGTERGIVKYVPGEGLQGYTLHDGLVSEQFQPNACMKASDGRIFFGSTNGFNAFYPFQIKTNNVMPPVYITSLSILNKEERTDEGLPVDLSRTKEIVIGYSDARMLTLSFASLSYCSPEKNQYAYMLEGFDREWNYVGNQHRATYTNLPAGTYTFRVKATNNDGAWSTNEAALKIVVHPPFWWSWYAKLFYLLLLSAVIWNYVRFRLKREEHRHQREIERLNQEKEKEVREARLNFFTMVAHEIRTPVSLIIGPLEKIMKKDKPSDDMRVIDRNARRLLELVNQLLDFRKVEQQSLVMRFAPQNIHDLIQSVSERFAPTFEQGGKRFSVEYPDEHFTAIVDKEAVTKVISNLLTNANKYTKDDVHLTCLVDPDGKHFHITVGDNGIGISEEDQQHIFEPFFQAMDNKPGTGIGLNIVKNIVDLHHGTISVASELGKGSTFTVTLPVSQEAGMATSIDGAEPVTISDSNADFEKPTNPAVSSPKAQRPIMLVVDDSEDMVAFLSGNFKEEYQIITAGDGIEALDQLKKHEVNIIISDWMMPRMDGAELCRRVRLDPQTSHIPFVMLTAKTDDDSKVQGMDVGADTYIEKPFSVKYLEACIRNMLEMRRRLIEKFSTQPLEPVTEIANNSTDNDFLVQMNKLIEENFSNSELNVNFLADHLNISRSGLFAKLKALADVTPNEMIQIVRLKHAARLLREGKGTVSEISYMVGFSTPSYFSKCFQKQFGIRPGDYMKS
jgi:signal transduction histidine kinase/ligand-binding sensor domain-containing protein/DNA-binding response OmpR family regulator